jgi:hypothetical protein
MTQSSSSSATTPQSMGAFTKLRLVALILLGMILFAFSAWLLSRAQNKPEKAAGVVVTERLKKLEANRAAAQTAVASYAWQDKATGKVRIPVDRAVELTIPELKNKPVKRSDVPLVPITSAPAPVPSPAPAGN